ncbi:unnamed protein product [[Candida] boidinii]|uniref:Unnamed protein product n=1 Tax=Candida boidinii TaxID=5477 RepID=A0ACB5TKN6_CANBO|nr:unnamed protein product [[Candida] boidinii]
MVINGENVADCTAEYEPTQTYDACAAETSDLQQGFDVNIYNFDASATTFLPPSFYTSNYRELSKAASTTGVTSKLSLTASHTSIMTTWGMSFSNSGLMVEIVTYLRATQDGLYYFVSGAYDEGLMIFMGIDAFDCCGSDILGSPEQYILYAQQPTKNSRDIAAVVYLTAGGFYPLRIVYYNHLQNMNFGLVIHAPDNSNHELTSELFNYHPATATGTCTMYTSSSAIPTNSEGVPTKSDGVPTNSDGVPTNSDGVPTNSLCQPTNSDGVPTGSDGNPIAPTNSDGVPTNSDGVPTNSLGQPTNSDGVPTGSDGNVLSTTSTGSVSVPGPVASVSFVSSVFEFSVGLICFRSGIFLIN